MGVPEMLGIAVPIGLVFGAVGYLLDRLMNRGTKR